MEEKEYVVNISDLKVVFSIFYIACIAFLLIIV
jgi:hypothetical protein